MILYFSGTGNSEYTAKRIREETDDNIMNLGEKIRSRDFSSIHSDTPWVVAAPTYAWRIPRILQEWLEKTELTGNRTIYFVMTCGGNRQIPKKANRRKRPQLCGLRPDNHA